jgi:hypothetical protein
MNFKYPLATLALIPAGVLTLHAQSSILQLQNNQLLRQLETPVLAGPTNAPELYSGENLDVGPQHILRPRPRHDYFDVLLDSQAYYSDNVNYSLKPGNVDTWVYVNTFQAAITPPAVELGAGKLAVTAGFASQWFNYDGGNNALDFNAQTLFFSGKYTWGHWQLAGGLNLTRLVSQQNDYAETYEEIQPNLGLQRVIPLNDRMFFTLGDLVEYHFTSIPDTGFGTRTDINDRFDNIVSVSFTWQPTRHLLVQPYYRLQYTYYNDDASGNYENDYLQSAGITAAYYFTPKISLRTFFNYNRRQSDDVIPSDYREINAGPGASLNILF